MVHFQVFSFLLKGFTREGRGDEDGCCPTQKDHHTVHLLLPCPPETLATICVRLTENALAGVRLSPGEARLSTFPGSCPELIPHESDPLPPLPVCLDYSWRVPCPSPSFCLPFVSRLFLLLLRCFEIHATTCAVLRYPLSRNYPSITVLGTCDVF